jgi:RNA polymerase sigma-70 factor (ECF subfamily)
MNEQSQMKHVESLISRLQAGDDSARGELINCVCDRLMNLTRKITQGYAKVQRWEDTDDVFQRAALRLFKSLEEVRPNDARHFFRLAAMQVRRELIDLARHYGGPQGMGGNHATQMAGSPDTASPHAAYDAVEPAADASELKEWSDFHVQIGNLPDEQREAVELLLYHGLAQEEAAQMMGVSVRTVKRYWRSAKLTLHEIFDGQLPGIF